MRTFPYPLVLASLLAACASAPQPQPEAAQPASAAPPPATAAPQPSEASTSSPSGSSGVAKQAPDVPTGEEAARIAENEGHSVARKENLIELMARAARFLEKHAGPTRASQPR